MTKSICASRHRKLLATATVLAATAAALAGGAAVRAGTATAAPVLRTTSAVPRPAVRHDTSPPLAEMAAQAGLLTATAAPVPALRVPHPTGAAALSGTNSFDGIADMIGYAPPYANAAVGTTQVVELVNLDLAVYSKTGTTILPATATDTLWSGFGGYCQTANDGQADGSATVSFDRMADRWIIQQQAFGGISPPNFDCVAVSATDDATGSYHRYAFESSTSAFLEDPKVAVWPAAYFVTASTFNASDAYLGAQVCAMNRSDVLNGEGTTEQCFTTSSTYNSLLGADLDGPAQPPAGEDETFVAQGATNTTLATWKFHVDFTNPGNSAFTGPTALTVAAYTLPCSGGGACIPQGGTTQQLDSHGGQMMYRAAYRNFGDHQSIVVNTSVVAGSSVGVNWYELRLDPAGAVSLFQQGTYAPDSTYRWMGSIAQDKAGDMALGYSQSSSTTHPSIRFTGRAPSDPPGTMTQAETTIVTGAASQTGTSEWGDYTSMAIDPVDDCTFWYTNEYIFSGGNTNWQTRLASFQMPGCTSTQGFTLYSSPSAGDVATPGGSVTTSVAVTETGTAQTVNLTASGLPSGTTATFTPSSLQATATSTLQLSTSSSTPDGIYPITITGTGTTGTESITYYLTVGPIPPDFAIAVNPIGSGARAPFTATATVSTTIVRGAAQIITFSISGLPAGVTAAFSPASVTTGGSSTLTITVPRKTAAGNYTLTITGTSPTLNRSAVYFLMIS